MSRVALLVTAAAESIIAADQASVSFAEIYVGMNTHK